MINLKILFTKGWALVMKSYHYKKMYQIIKSKKIKKNEFLKKFNFLKASS